MVDWTHIYSHILPKAQNIKKQYFLFRLANKYLRTRGTGEKLIERTFWNLEVKRYKEKESKKGITFGIRFNSSGSTANSTMV